ncbi:MAG: hypothetical protein IJK23_10280 [Clostridia bacterium]|nr:hypothetical protein [Clostridia bacterium]
MYGLHPWQNEIGALGRQTPSMRFSGNMPLHIWQCAARAKLETLLGMEYFHRCDELFSIESVEDKGDRSETRFVFQTEEGYFVPCVFVKPKKPRCEKPPVMICLQGHSTGMHNSLGVVKYPGDAEDVESGDRDYAVQCAELGLCAVTLEQRCFGECGGTPNPDCYTSAMTAILSGRTVLGGRVWDVERLIDVLETHFADECDVNSVYCMGNSGGGTATIYATALETRIKGAIPSCSFCTFLDSIGNKWHCACNYVPGIAKYFDMAELGGMIAPRPLTIVTGKTDPIFPSDAAAQEFARVRDIYYKEAGAPEMCAQVIGDGGHRFYKADAWPVFFRMTEASEV